MSQLVMEKSDLAVVPNIPLADGYRLRNYQRGDETGLARVYAASILGTETEQEVEKNILSHPCFRPERVFIVEHDGRVIGTSAAWVESDDPDVGYLHMVGLLPEHRGKQLGAFLIVASIGYSRAEGFDRQRLKTDDWREPALRLYADLGYYPLFTDDSHPGRWEEVARKLGRPHLLERSVDLRSPSLGQ